MSTAEERILGYLEKNDEIEDSGNFAAEQGIDHADVVNVVKSLHGFRYVDVLDIKRETWVLTEEGRTYATEGSPEFQLFEAVPPEGSISKDELQKKVGPVVFRIGCSQAGKNKWVEMGKQVSRKVQQVEDRVKDLLLQIQDKKAIAESDIKSLKTRKLIALETWKGYSIKKGPNYAPQRRKPATDLTQDNLLRGDWKNLERPGPEFDQARAVGYLLPMVRERPGAVEEENDRQSIEGENGKEEEEEEEEGLVALIEHRAREVDHIKNRISSYTSQLEEAEKKLSESESLLTRFRGGRSKGSAARSSVANGSRSVGVEAENPSVSRTVKLASKPVVGSSSKRPSPVKVKEDKSSRSSSGNGEGVGTKKRKFEEKEHKELIPQVCRSSSPCNIRCYASNHIPSQHKRKLRSLALCPANDQLFVTSALDGMVNLWQIQARGSGASMISATECLSQTRHWPEDTIWHPSGSSIISTYTADSGDSQISVIDLNKKQGKDRVAFLADKPHTKGIINSISFMPWDNAGFVTGGSDHAAVLWHERDEDNSWKPRALHRNAHSSAVMGVAGLPQKHIVLSVGADKRIVGFDVQAGRTAYTAQVDSKCMSVLPNPCDFNLFMVQTGTPQKQLRLFDVRLRRTEIHTFGFKQESSDIHSALINQAWSPDGWYLVSGTVDPLIHVFDIRYNSHKPSQSIKAHQKRVFKAVWHSSLPLLISISSDGQVGLHKME